MSRAEDPDRWVVTYASGPRPGLTLLVATALGNTTKGPLTPRDLTLPKDLEASYFLPEPVPFSVDGNTYLLVGSRGNPYILSVSDTQQSPVTVGPISKVPIGGPAETWLAAACAPGGQCLFGSGTSAGMQYVYGSLRRLQDGTPQFSATLSVLDKHLITAQYYRETIAYANDKFVAVGSLYEQQPRKTTPDVAPLPCVSYTALRELKPVMLPDTDGGFIQDTPLPFDGLVSAHIIKQDVPIKVQPDESCSHYVTASRAPASVPAAFRFDLQLGGSNSLQQWIVRLDRQDGGGNEAVGMRIDVTPQPKAEAKTPTYDLKISFGSFGLPTPLTVLHESKSHGLNGKVTILSDANMVQVFCEDGRYAAFQTTLGATLDRLCIGTVGDREETVTYNVSTYTTRTLTTPQPTTPGTPAIAGAAAYRGILSSALVGAVLMQQL